MSASGLMSIGVRAMNANYVGLQTSGHNIANAGVEGYTRQQVELQTALGQFSGAGFFGKGVDVKTVARVYDQFLTREAMTARAQSSFDGARLDRLQQLESRLAGHADVGNEHLGRAAGERVERLARGREGAERNALATERLLDHPADRAVVVDDPDRLHEMGSRILNAVRPGRDSNSITPW